MIANLDLTLPNSSLRQLENAPGLPADRSDPKAAEMFPGLNNPHPRVQRHDINRETHPPSVDAGTGRDEKAPSAVEAASAQQASQP